jgi:hypothetical protein
MGYFSNIKPDLFERLALLAEECAETIQIINKIFRHGYNSYHPFTEECNSDLIEEEISHVLAAIELLIKNNDINSKIIEQYKNAKLDRIKEYLHHN